MKLLSENEVIYACGRMRKTFKTISTAEKTKNCIKQRKANNKLMKAVAEFCFEFEEETV